VLFDPAVLQLLLASQATVVRHLWRRLNNADAGSSQAAAAVQPYHKELLTAMGVPAADQQQRDMWDIVPTEMDALRALGDTLVVNRFLWRRWLLLQQGAEDWPQQQQQ
jgi:hypothetical protein